MSKRLDTTHDIALAFQTRGLLEATVLTNEGGPVYMYAFGLHVPFSKTQEYFLHRVSLYTQGDMTIPIDATCYWALVEPIHGGDLRHERVIATFPYDATSGITGKKIQGEHMPKIRLSHGNYRLLLCCEVFSSLHTSQSLGYCISFPAWSPDQHFAITVDFV
jgi:hypothetical protein